MDKSKSARRNPGSFEQLGTQIDATGLMQLGANNLQITTTPVGGIKMKIRKLFETTVTGLSHWSRLRLWQPDRWSPHPV